MFKITLQLAMSHNHRWDTAYDGRYMVRLPDRRQVYAENYAAELAKLKERDPSPGVWNVEDSGLIAKQSKEQ